MSIKTRKSNGQGHTYKVGNSWKTVITIQGRTVTATANSALGDKVQAYAMTHGFTVAFKFSAGLLFIGAIVLFFFINIGKESLVEREDAVIL